MLTRQETTNKPKPKKGKVSQREAARILGVTPWHLNHVLRGRRISHSLLRRWNELQQEETR